MLFARLLERQRAAADDCNHARRRRRERARARRCSSGAGSSSVGHRAHRARGRPKCSRQSNTSSRRIALAGLRPQRETVTWTTLAATIRRRLSATEEGGSTARRTANGNGGAEGKEADHRAAAKADEEQPPIQFGDSIMTELQVDSAVVRFENSAAPAYPESMLKRRIEGSVIVQYVVDTLGHADTLTFRVIASTHADFARAVKNTLPLHAIPARRSWRIVTCRNSCSSRFRSGSRTRQRAHQAAERRTQRSEPRIASGCRA